MDTQECRWQITAANAVAVLAHHGLYSRSSMITLVHAPRSRSSGFLWLLEEVGEPYQVQYVSIRRGDGSGSLDPANPHPHGKVPVLLDGTTVVFEQSAIALYLADKYPGANLGPRIEDPARGDFLTFLAYYCGVVEPAFTSKFLRVAVPRGTAGWVDSAEVMDFINARLGRHSYLAGEQFTAADVLYASAFSLFMDSPLLEGKRTPQLRDYVARCVSRPARARAAAKDQPSNSRQ
ncbi:MAG TPA: glutathione S-transferase family protein [Steroidobacteraceae bacterium]|nr:glutathione S-transferase family protein [Steroidobacteraceae bacterium]